MSYLESFIRSLMKKRLERIFEGNIKVLSYHHNPFSK